MGNDVTDRVIDSQIRRLRRRRVAGHSVIQTIRNAGHIFTATVHRAPTQSDEICITHQDMADMLMIRRANITDALHLMEGNLLITSTRNKIVMRHRPGLFLVAGSTYGLAEEHYSRHVAPLFK